MSVDLLLRGLLAVFVAVASWFPAYSHADTNSVEEPPFNPADKIPLMVVENTPLLDAIRNVARQAELNVIFDPVLAGVFPLSSGDLLNQPEINVRMTNVTAWEAIESLVKARGLTLIENPATSVARITFSGRSAKPVDATQVIGNTNKIPLQMINGDLGEVLSELTKNAGLNASVDVSVLAPVKVLGSDRSPTVYCRCVNISPAQALAALLDAYDLRIVKLGETGKYRISRKPPETQGLPKKH